jgi:RNA polymerase sigma factor (sigma-70 family)
MDGSSRELSGMRVTSSVSEEIGARTVLRAQRGDPRALDELLRKLMPYLGRICGAIALDRGDDALQETMIAVMRHIGSVRDPAAIRGWARQIAVREAMRQAARTEPIPLDPAVLEGTRGGSQTETAVDVRDALSSMSPDQRAVLVLQHFEGLTEEEMAEVLGVAAGTVKSRLNRARTAFRTRWTS